MTNKEKIILGLKDLGCCGGDSCEYEHDYSLRDFVSKALDTYAKQQVEEFKQSLKQKKEEMKASEFELFGHTKKADEFQKSFEALLSSLSPDQVDEKKGSRFI